METCWNSWGDIGGRLMIEVDPSNPPSSQLRRTRTPSHHGQPPVRQHGSQVHRASNDRVVIRGGHWAAIVAYLQGVVDFRGKTLMLGADTQPWLTKLVMQLVVRMCVMHVSKLMHALVCFE